MWANALGGLLAIGAASCVATEPEAHLLGLRVGLHDAADENASFGTRPLAGLDLRGRIGATPASWGASLAFSDQHGSKGVDAIDDNLATLALTAGLDAIPAAAWTPGTWNAHAGAGLVLAQVRTESTTPIGVSTTALEEGVGLVLDLSAERRLSSQTFLSIGLRRTWLDVEGAEIGGWDAAVGFGLVF